MSTHRQILLHLIFATKNRRPWIDENLASRLHPYLGGIVREAGGDALLIGGHRDHIHALVAWRTDDTIANLLRQMKAKSSRWIHQEFHRLADFAWQDGYSVFSVSPSQRRRVERYIADQEEHHRTRSSRDELVELLEAHGVKYDERYL